jgi:hypothetical protein
MARTFDPVGAFQGARGRALQLQSAEQGIARESAAAPIRNQLAELQLGQAKVGAQRGETKFGQEQALRRATILGQSARALRGLPLQQRDAAFASIEPQLEQFGIPRGTFRAGQFTDSNLDRAIAEAQAFTGAPAAQAGFTLSQGQQRFGPGGQVIAGVAPAPAKGTSLQQNLIAAGLTPGTPEFRAAVLKATTKPTTIIGTGEKEESKELAKLRVKRFGSIQEAADNATTLLDNLNQLDAIDVTTGALEPAKVAIAAIAEGFGIDASSIANATTAQAFNAVSTKLVNEILNAATGPQTDQDADRARKTIASLGDTPGAATFKNNSLRSLALRQVEQRDFIAEQLDKDKNLSESNKEWREFKRKTPSLSSIVKGPDGLPVFFFQFKNSAQTARPGISDQEIIDAWRDVHGK